MIQQHTILLKHSRNYPLFFLGALKGVMRVGVLAKGLLLHERLDVDLVVLCHGKKLSSIPFLKQTFQIPV